MSPADLQEHTAKVAALLRGTAHKRLEQAEGTLNPYVPFPEAPAAPAAADSPTFGWSVGWSDLMKQSRPGWETILNGFRASLAVVYPGAGVAAMEIEMPEAKMFPLYGAQINAKLRRSVRGDLIITDIDVVANRRCNAFAAADFDVGLTDCAELWPLMPFNAGVMFLRDTPGAQRFLDTAMEAACAIPQNMDSWYAYQLGMRVAYDLLKDEVRFAVFPHQEYNFTPDEFCETDAYFVHLKGHRKHLHPQFVHAVLKREGRL